MGLENLKSIFTEGIGEFKNTSFQDRGLDSDYDNIESPFISSGPGGNAGLLPFAPGDIESMHFSGGSLLTENISSFANTFISNRPQDINDSKLANNYNFTIPQTHQFEVNSPAPILDTLLRQPPSFVSDDLTIKFYNQQQFDSRISKNIGITITNVNTYSGTIHTSTNPTDFSTSGNGQGFQGAPPFIPPLSQLGLDLESSGGWASLYHSDHTPRNIDTTLSTPFQPYLYGGNVNRDNLDIRKKIYRGGSSIFSPSRHSNIGGVPESGVQNEPYIVSEIGEEGRDINKGNRSVPIVRATTDTLRITKFLSSPAGVSFMALQNLYSQIPTSVVRGLDDVTLLDSPDNSLYRVPQRFNTYYNPLSTETAISPLARNLGQSSPNILVRRDGDILGGLFASSTYEVGGGPTGFNFTSIFDSLPSYRINDTFTYGYKQVKTSNKIDNLLDQLSSDVKSVILGGEKIAKTTLGDKMTLSPLIKGTSLDVQTNTTLPVEQNVTEGTKADGSNQLTYNVESKKEGMPFWFKDLRDDTYIFFRAYIMDLIENVVPTWNPATYIGRSSPVYNYQSTERDIGFTLKLFANTESELEKIYEKLNRLTSLCYPQYVQDDRLTINQGSITEQGEINLTPIFQSNRMKPPLTKLRIGELYSGHGISNGSITKKSKDGLLGFIETLNYTIPQEGTWETKQGKRVPKYIMATIAFRVIHSEVPALKDSNDDNYNFYGYTGNEV